MVVGVDRDRDDVRVDAEDRAEERELDAPQAGIAEDAPECSNRLGKVCPERPDGARISRFDEKWKPREDFSLDARLVGVFSARPSRNTKFRRMRNMSDESNHEHEDVEAHSLQGGHGAHLGGPGEHLGGPGAHLGGPGRNDDGDDDAVEAHKLA
jgi:hypothetical protein